MGALSEHRTDFSADRRKEILQGWKYCDNCEGVGSVEGRRKLKCIYCKGTGRVDAKLSKEEATDYLELVLKCFNVSGTLTLVVEMLKKKKHPIARALLKIVQQAATKASWEEANLEG